MSTDQLTACQGLLRPGPGPGLQEVDSTTLPTSSHWPGFSRAGGDSTTIPTSSHWPRASAEQGDCHSGFPFSGVSLRHRAKRSPLKSKAFLISV